jgi:hypothetical protein
VLLELVPLLAGDADVLALGTQGAAVVQKLLVVLDDVLGEARDVALRGLEIQVSEQGRADVDRQAAVDDVGGEEPAEVVWRELRAGERVPTTDLPSGGPGHVHAAVDRDAQARQMDAQIGERAALPLAVFLEVGEEVHRGGVLHDVEEEPPEGVHIGRG